MRSAEKAEAEVRELHGRIGERLRAELGPAVQAWLRSPEAVAIHTRGRFVLVNDACARLFGFESPCDLIGRSGFELARDEDRASLEQSALRLASGAPVEPGTVHKFLRADGVPIDVETTSVRFTSCDDTFVMTIARDVTERQAALVQTERNEAALREAQRIARIGSWDLNLVTGELTWSEEIYRIFEIDPRDFRASYQAFLDLIHPDDRELVNVAYEHSVQAREPYSVEHRLLMRDGRIKHVHERGMTFYDAEGRPLRSVGTVQDVSARVAADRAIAEREQLLQTIVDASPDWIFAKDHEFRFLMVNRAMAQAVGRTPSELVGRRDTDFWPVEECEPGQSTRGFHDDDAAALRGEFVRVEREVASTAQGIVVLNTVKGPLRDPAGNIFGAYAYARDITESDRIEQAHRDSEARLSLIFNTTQDLLVLLSVEPDQSLLVLAANRAASAAFGSRASSVEQLIGQRFQPLLSGLLNEPDVDMCLREHNASLETLMPRSYAFVSQVLSGRHFDVTVTPVAGQQGQAKFLLWAARDNTERARAESSLRESESRIVAQLEEKEVLLREVHHRVKNNLQVVSSLLFLQRQRAQSPELNAMLRDSAARVSAMALVHEMLFAGGKLANVDMRAYARELGVALMSTYAIERDRIRLDVRGAPFQLSLDRATPYALIINEIITNSLKHGFPAGRSGRISIELESDGDDWTLTIGDDGVGAPPNVLTTQSQSLGVRLVVRLVEQLDAKIERLPDPGTFYRIRSRIGGVR